MKRGQTGKYFEAQFVKSFNNKYIGRKDLAILRLKDCGFIKRADIGDYIIFYKDKVLNIELKAQKDGKLYSSEIREDQIKKWSNFEYSNIRIPIYIVKNEATKEIGIFFKDEILEMYKNGKIDEKNAKLKIRYGNQKIPYNFDEILKAIDDKFAKKKKSNKTQNLIP